LRLFQLNPVRLVQISNLCSDSAHTKINILPQQPKINPILFINGSPVVSRHQQVYTGDTVFMVESLALVFTTLKLLSQPFNLTSYFFNKNLVLKVEDTPNFLEVDELCYSISVLFEPHWWLKSTKEFGRQFPFTTYKLYNWKYST